MGKIATEKEIREYEEIERWIIEITTGLRHVYIDEKHLIFKFSTPEEEQWLEKECEQHKDLMSKEGLWTRDEMRSYLVKDGFLAAEQARGIRRLEEQIEILSKKEKRLPHPDDKAKLQLEIKRVREIKSQTEEVELQFMGNTVETKLNEFRFLNLVALGVMDSRRKLLWDSPEIFWESRDLALAKRLIPPYAVFMNGYSTNIIRRIARSPGWRTRWAATTKSASPIFKGNVTDWNVNQVQLCYWSNVYDSVYNHPDCPEDSIVNSDSMLDGWIEMQGNKARKKKKTFDDRNIHPSSSGRAPKTSGGVIEDTHNFIF